MKRFILMMLTNLIPMLGFGQTTLKAGDIAVVMLNVGPTPMTWSWVPLVDISSGTVIYFTDNGWNGASNTFIYSEAIISGASQNDNLLTFTATSAIPKGTVITFDGATFTPSVGTLSWLGATIPPRSSSGDQLLVYQGSFASPTFVAGVHMDYNSSLYDATTKWHIDAVPNALANSSLPPGLTNGVTAVSVFPEITEQDNAKYTGATTNGTRAELLAAINNYANWSSDNTTPFTWSGNFTVNASLAAPTVTSVAAASIGATSATLGGEVTADGGATVSDRGVAYSLSSANTDPRIGGAGVSQVSIGSGVGSFSQSVGSLSRGVSYHFNAYAINSVGTNYGSVRSFTTLVPGMGVAGNGNAIASGAAAAAANGTKFHSLLSGASWTNTFTITNNGTEALALSGFGISDLRFEIEGMPATVAAGTASNFTVRFAPDAVGSFAGALTISNDSPTVAYVVNLAGSCFAVSTDAGPFGGGNEVTFTNGNFGTITNVLVGGAPATILDSGASWFTVVMPAATSAGLVELIVQTSDNGDTTLANAYRYNPAGWIADSGLVRGGPYIAGGGWHSLGVKSDGTVAAWGQNTYGQANAPAPNADFVAVAGGSEHSLGLKSDGTIVAWGHNDDGEINVPAPNADFTAVAAGFDHSLGLKSDGTIVAWGQNTYGQASVPAPNADFVAVAAGGQHSLGLKSDGTIAAWGYNDYGQTSVPAPNADFVAVAAGNVHSLGLKSDGTIVAWGYNHDGQANAPATNADFVAVAAGDYHSLGLKSDGTVVAWGDNTHGQSTVPAPNADFVAVAGGYWHSLGLKSDGTIVAWGHAGDGETSVPAPNADFGTFAYGVLPASGSWTGGYEVVISGTNLCNGTLSDVTGVTLCGAPATVTGVSGSTQIVVTAGVAVSAGAGDVVVQSTSFGETVGTNAFTYNAPGMQVLGTNGAAIVSGDDAQAANGTKFAPLLSGASWTSTFSITNNGTEALSISGFGHVNPAFEITGIPTSVAAGGTSQFTVKFSPTSVGTYNDWLTISNDSPTAAYLVRLYGPCFRVSTNAGPFGGGNAITIANGYFGDITNVLVDGVAATLVESSGSIFTIELPAATHAGTVDILVQTSDEGDVTLANAYTYHPAGQIGGEPDWSQWVEVAGLPTTRFDMGAGVLSNRIYGVGGANESAVGQTNVYCYDGTNWTEVPGLPAGRFQAVAGEVNGALIVAGGSPDGSSSRTNAYRFTGTGWEEVAGMPNTFWDMAGATYAGAFYVIGGGYYGPKTNVYRFDGTNWTEVAGLPAPRDSMGAAACGGYLYAVGGVDSTFGEDFRTNVYRYDGTIWTEVAGLPAPRGAPGVAARDGALFVAGGQTEEDSGFGMPMPVQHTNVYRFDGTGWTEVAGLPRAWGNLLLANPNDTLYAFGGSPMATNTYRYPAAAGASGVEPASGSWTGGYEVVISGTNLCDGTPGDVTGVTLCGVAATVTGVSGGTQIVATAGAAAAAGPGDVRVFSTSYGETVKSNGFEYLRAEPAALAFAPASPQAYGTTNALAASGGSGTGAVSYAVTAGPGTIAGGTNLAITAGTGDVVVVATKAQDDLYFATAATATVAAAKADQVIADFLPTNGSAFAATDAAGLSATASSGLAVAFAVGSGPGSISGGTNLTFTGAGSVAVVASQAGDANWNAAASATQTFVVAKAPQAALAFAPASPQTFGTTNALSASGGSGTGAVSYSIAAGLGEIVGTNGLHALAGTGSVTVVATKAADDLYLSVAATATVAYVKAAAQVFLLDLSQTYDGTARTITATTMPAGLTVEFTYAGHAWAPTNAGSYAATGTVTDADWQGSAAGTLAVARAQDAIVFGATNQTYDGTARIVTATAGSGSAVALTYDGNAWAPTNAGTYAVTGMVDAVNWTLTNTTTLTVTKADQVITNILPPDGTQFAVGASTSVSAQASSGLAVTFFIGGPATVTGDTNLLFTGPGMVNMLVSQPGNANWNATFCTNLLSVGGLITNVAPGAANVGGGIEVTIQGIALGDGTDVTNVALCGVAATIVTQSADAVTVMAAAAAGPATGAVEVASGTGGRMVLSNAFEYLWLDAPVQLAPTDVLLDRLTARWQAVSNATAYFLEAGLDEAFAAHVPGYEFLDAGAATNAPVDGLLDKTPYWLRVFAWNDHGLSWASLVRRVATPAVNAADFDADGLADLAAYQPATGIWSLRSFGTGAAWSDRWGWSNALPVPADYDGDGVNDVAVYHPASGIWRIRKSTGGSREEAFGWSAAVPVPGDYDGDGTADLAIYHAATGRWYFRLSGGGADYGISWGWSATVPVPADYDGDGTTDLAVYHPATGDWYVLKSRTQTLLQVRWGWANAVPVPGDYEGDGKADIAVYHRASGNWHIRYSSGIQWQVPHFGWAGTIPVQADYDGDGIADLAIYHPATGNWSILRSATGTLAEYQLGGPGQIPVLPLPLIHSWFGLP